MQNFSLIQGGQNKKRPKKIGTARYRSFLAHFYQPTKIKMKKTAKTAKISKEIYNYLRDNENEAKQVLKSLEKRRKKDLPMQLDNSSQISQSAIVEVDLTGMKPIVLEGQEATRDMPVVPRKRKSVTPHSEQELLQVEERHFQVPEEQQVEAQEQLQVDDRPFQVPEEQQVDDEQEQEEGIQELNEEEDGRLPEKLQIIVNDLYSSVNSPIFNRTVSQTPLLELNEFSFVPLTNNALETLHLSSFKDNGLLAEKTRTTSDSSYSLRCFNTYLAKQALVKKLMDVDPTKSEAQVLYSLCDRISQESYVDIEWNQLKQCSKRGKALYDFMKELNLGTYCNSFY